MNTYEAVFDENSSEGVFAISLVHDPATRAHFVALSEQQIQLAAIDEKEFILAGVVLSPDVLIYRNQGGEEFNMTFSDKTVKDLCYAFTKNKFNNNSSEEHNNNSKIEGISFVENWIVRDEKNDTSISLGLKPKKGDWVSVAKCDNKEIYNKALAGEFKGFSIEAMLSLKKVNLKSEIKMESNLVSDFIKDVKTALGLDKPKEVKLGSVKSGDIDIMFDGDMLVIGEPVWVVAEDESKIPLPAGEYLMDEKNEMLIVSEEGVVGEIKNVEEVPAELEEAAPAVPNNEVLNQIKSLLIKYNEDANAKYDALTIRFDAMEKENKDLKENVVKLSQEPAAKKIVATPVALNSKGRLLEKLRG
jgi:hypothetical protein